VRAWLHELLVAFFGLAAAVAAACVVGEVAVRLSAGHPLWPIVPPTPYIDNSLLFRKNATRLYEISPGIDDVVGYGYVRITINRSGFRDDVDPIVPKPAGTWRAIVLGDSFTFGGKVQLADTFAKRLEKLLGARDPARRYEVLNLGVPGYKSEQELALLREQGMGLEPDLVIVAVTMSFAGAPVQLYPDRQPAWPAFHRFIKRFDFVQFLYTNWKRYASLLREGFSQPERTYPDLAEGSPYWEASKADLREMARVTEEKGVGLLVVLWPMLVRLDGDYPYTAEHRRVVEACEKLEIPVLDLLPSFRGIDVSTLWATRDDHHPNPIAQQRAAELVLGSLLERAMLPPATAVSPRVSRK
jgi:hypothetical protein